MHELIRLLTEFGADDATIALAQRLIDAGQTDVEPLTDDELETLLGTLVGLADDDEASAALLGEAADAAAGIRAEQDRRVEALEADEAERAAAAARLRGDEPEANGDDDEADADGEGDEPADGEGEGDAPADDAEAVEDGEREPALTAAGRPARVDRSALARRRPPSAAPPEVDETLARIVFSADVPNIPAGHEVRGDLQAVDRAIEARAEAFRRSSTSRGREDIPVARVFADYPAERRLVDDRGMMLPPQLAGARIDEALGAGLRNVRTAGNALVAAGGLCVLPTPLYNMPVLGDDRRPIRDEALTSFQATRGGVIQLAPPTLPDLQGAVSVWTVADDESATDGSPTKPCLRVECGDERSAVIEAIPLCLTWGNFMARTYGELPNAWTELGMVAHARFAELRLWAAMRTLSTLVNTETTVISAVRDVLEVLDRAAVGYRSRHRLALAFPFRAILPETFLGVARTDIARAMPGGSFAENLNLAEATLRSFFTSRNINVTWSPDINMMGQQAAATALADYPPAIDWLLYPEGTFIHLDGGTLDLGLVRDSTLNGTNDVQTFVETFEGVHRVGHQSIGGTINVCPSGAVSGTLNPAALCASYT